MKTLKAVKTDIRGIRELQKQSMEKEKDDYMVGLYNGIEMVLAIMENREPEFEACVREPEVIEQEKEIGRTVASGKRVIRK